MGYQEKNFLKTKRIGQAEKTEKVYKHFLQIAQTAALKED